jgi:GTPase SAR1 family protein
MPFGQLIIGSPGAGKTTYCAGAQAFLHALDRPAAVVNLDPANERRLLPYAPAVDINELISVADVMREFGLGPNVS